MVIIKIGSINCLGLASDKIKRQDIFLKCRQNYDITLLVDTHCKKELEIYWRSELGYKARFCSHTTDSRGVAILFKNSSSSRFRIINLLWQLIFMVQIMIVHLLSVKCSKILNPLGIHL
jgi:hypothetical protein